MPRPSTSGPPDGGFNSSDAPYIAKNPYSDVFSDPHYSDANPQAFDNDTGQFSENQPMRYSLNEMRNARGASNGPAETTVDPQVYRRIFYVIAVTIIIVGFAGVKKS